MEFRKNQFVVVLFSDGLQVVPRTWIDGRSCAWPSYTSHARTVKAITGFEKPEPNWTTHEILRIFGSSDSYEDAIEKMKLSEKYSDVESGQDSEQKRKKRQLRARKQQSSDDSETDEEVSQSLLKKFPKVPKVFQPLAVSTQINTTNENLTDESPNPNSLVADSPSLVADINSQEPNSSVASIGASNVPSFHSTSGLDCTGASDCQRMVVKKLNFIIFKLRCLEEKINNLEERKKPPVAVNLDVIHQLGLPLSSVDSVEEAENILKEPTSFDALVQHLGGIGGQGIVSCVNTVLRRLITNSTASQYSWSGFKGKKPFKHLRLSQVVLHVVRLHVQAATETEVAEHIQAWLKHAKTRLIRTVRKEVGNSQQMEGE